MLWQHYLKLSCQGPDVDTTEGLCKVAYHCKPINSTTAGSHHTVNLSDKQKIYLAVAAALLLWWYLGAVIGSKLQAKTLYLHKTSCLFILLSGLLLFAWKECFPIQDKTSSTSFKIIICCEKSVTRFYNRISCKWRNETRKHLSLCNKKHIL